MAAGGAALITGVTGQDGAYLARLLVDKGYRVHGTTRHPATADLGNLQALGIAERVRLHATPPGDPAAIASAVREAAPREIYCLAAQSSVGASFERPAETAAASFGGLLEMLEAVRRLDPGIRVFNACSGECFGNVPGAPASEETPFRPCSPYGVAKAAAYWLTVTYRDAYGLFAASGILFAHESPLRPAHFVTQKIVRAAVDIAAGGTGRLHLGNLAVVRDWGYAPEYVEAMWRMLQLAEPCDFVIATGRAATLRSFVEQAFAAVGLDWHEHVDADPALLRPVDIARSVGLPDKAQRRLGWTPRAVMPGLVARLVNAERRRRAPPSGRSADLPDADRM